MTNAWLSLAHDKVWADPGPAAPTASSGLPPDRAVRATGCGASAPPPGYRSDRSPGAPYADARSHCRAPGRTLGCCAVSSLVRQRVSWLLRHSLRQDSGMVLVVLGATISRGKRPDGLPVSTALTSQAHRRRTPKKNRRIPTIPTGCFGGRLVHVSAVDTGPRGSESGVLGGRARRCRGVEPPPQLPPTLRRLPHPAPATRGPITRHQRHDLKHQALSGARAKARWSWFNADPARTEPAPPESAYSTRVGIYWPRVVRTARGPHLPAVPPTLVQWHPTLVQCAQTTPAGTRAAASSRAGPTREASSGSRTRSAHPTSVLRCQDIRNSQKS